MKSKINTIIMKQKAKKNTVSVVLLCCSSSSLCSFLEGKTEGPGEGGCGSWGVSGDLYGPAALLARAGGMERMEDGKYSGL